MTARLEAAGGDWDLAIFDARGGRLVGASAYRGSEEVASGFAISGERLVVQACRLSGASETAKLSVDSTAIDTSRVEKVSLVRVATPTAARKRELANLGLDLTEHGGKDFLEVVLHGADDARKLIQRNFVHTLEIPDLSLQARRDRAEDCASRPRPTGRTCRAGARATGACTTTAPT